MAGAVVEILYNFVTDVQDIQKGAEAVKQGMGDAAGGMSVATKAAGTLKTAALNAGIAAGAMAAEWAISGVAIASDANKIAANFEAVTGDADSMSGAVEDLAGHMGLAEHEAKALLAQASALGQSMGMSQEAANEFAESIFQMGGDLARFNPEAGSAEDAINAITAAANGSTKGLAAWGISIKSAEVNNLALAQSGKETTAELTQQDKALATTTLVMEKMGEAQGELTRDIEDGSTEISEAKADIDDMQVAVGNALMPVKKLALQGFLVLADVLIALEPAISAIGDLLEDLLTILKPVIDLVGILAHALGVVLGGAVQLVMKILQPFVRLLDRISGSISHMMQKISSIRLPDLSIPGFHSGGTVPGASGTLQPIMAQGGERVSTQGQDAHAGGGGGGGTVVNITVQSGISSPDDVARTIADLLTDYTQSQGAIDVKVTGN